MKRCRRNPVVARRDLLRLGAAGAASAVGLSGLGSLKKALAECSPTDRQTEGPFWVDEMLNRSDIRSDPATGELQAGVPLRLSINVSEIRGGSCAPVAGAYVDIWQCDALGIYSDVTGFGNPDTVGQAWLRGYQVTDVHGNVRFLDDLSRLVHGTERPYPLSRSEVLGRRDDLQLREPDVLR